MHQKELTRIAQTNILGINLFTLCCDLLGENKSSHDTAFYCKYLCHGMHGVVSCMDDFISGMILTDSPVLHLPVIGHQVRLVDWGQD